MHRMMIVNAQNYINKSVKVEGWVDRIKKLKSVVFMIIRDRTGYLQCAMTPEVFKDIKIESVVRLKGIIVDAPNKYGDFELATEQVDILSEVKDDLPFSINVKALNCSIDTLLNHRTLSLRHKQEHSIFKVQNKIVDAFRTFLQQHSFNEIRTPKIVKEGAEGGANVFVLDYFGQSAYLAQSPQFYKQMMVASGMEKVFEIAPAFRAEPHSTARHLNEYISMDIEMGFIDSEETLMTFENTLLIYIFNQLNQYCKKALTLLGIKTLVVPERIPRIRLEEAIEILKEEYGMTHLKGDLDPAGEEALYRHIYNKTGSEFVFLTHYPKEKRPMYTLPCEEFYTRSFDLLYKGVEITTGGLRIHRLEMLIKNMQSKGLDPSHYKSYLDIFRYGMPPHGGFAIGLERLTAKVLNIHNIRRASMFPRDVNRLTP